MKIDFVVVTYGFYLAISIALTIWVARTLFRNGRIFLVDVFHGNAALADSVNHLLVVGFYLINLGYVTMALKLGYDVTSTRGSIEALSAKVGWVLLVLGGMHFFNLYVFSAIRRRPVRSLPAARRWLAKQPKYVSMAFVEAGSEAARQRFPSLEVGDTLEELTVVGRRGEVYRGAKAWIMCLWALKRYRSAALRLSTPEMQPVARRLVAWVSRNRFRIGEAAGWTR
jgi:hypothetical protein